MIKLIKGNAFDVMTTLPRHDLMFTDPPFDMSTGYLSRLMWLAPVDHALMIGTLRQTLAVCNAPGWHMAFEMVLDTVTPAYSRSYRQPHYTHNNVVYLRRGRVPSLFDRRRGSRSDAFGGKYWPTIVRAPKDRLADYGYAKNEQAITDILSAFDANWVLDPFAGTGTTGLAAFENDRKATLIEQNDEAFEIAVSTLQFLGGQVEVDKNEMA